MGFEACADKKMVPGLVNLIFGGVWKEAVANKVALDRALTLKQRKRQGSIFLPFQRVKL